MEAEQLCADGTNNTNRNSGWKAQGGVFYHINLPVEPRASSGHTQDGRSHHGRTAQGMVGVWYTQGCIPGHIAGGGIPTIPTLGT